jgi:hypothetical protein
MFLFESIRVSAANMLPAKKRAAKIEKIFFHDNKNLEVNIYLITCPITL